MSRHINCLRAACEELGIDYEYDPGKDYILVLKKNGKREFFIGTHTPFNTHMAHEVVNDKFLTYELFEKSFPMPVTKSYFDPAADYPFSKYVEFKDMAAIVADIEKNFKLPTIIKMNSGSRGENVSLCNSVGEIGTALTKIFTPESRRYDHLALAQDYIERKHEYRVIVFAGETKLVYEKITAGAKFVGNLSPLHWEGATAKIITERSIQEQIQHTFVEKIFANLDIAYAGLDIIVDENDKLWLLEINANPGYEYLLNANDDLILSRLYQDILPVYLNLGK